MEEKIEEILINETIHIDSGWDETKWIPQNKVPEIAKEISALFPRWISVDEKLPEDADIYWAINNEGSLVRWNYYRIQIDNYHGNIVYWTTDEEMAKILPKLPKE